MDDSLFQVTKLGGRKQRLTECGPGRRARVERFDGRLGVHFDGAANVVRVLIDDRFGCYSRSGGCDRRFRRLVDMGQRLLYGGDRQRLAARRRFVVRNESLGPGDLWCRRVPSEREAIKSIDCVTSSVAILSQNSLRQESRLLMHEGVVEQIERLGRHRRFIAAAGD